MSQLKLKSDFIHLMNLSLPLVFTGLVQSSLGYFETLFLAQLGEKTLAAGALVNWLFATLVVIIFGTFGAINVLIAHQYGAKDHEKISLVLRDGLLIAVLLAIPAFFMFWNISSVLLFFKQSPEIAQLANVYLHALAWGLFPKFIMIVLFEFVMGLGHARTIMKVMLLSIPVYIFMSFTLIFGKFGFPALGISGAGWAMTISDWIIFSILFLSLWLSKSYRPYLRSIFSFKKPSFLWEIVHIGLPMGAMFCMEVGFFFAVALIMGTISIQALAANQITMQYLGMLISITFSIAQAITIQMGHQLGANQFENAKNTAFSGIFMSVVVMMGVAMCYWFIPELLISVDLDLHNAEYQQTIALAKQFLFIMAFFQIFESIRISYFGALRALKDTRFTLFTSIIGFWLIPFPIGYGLAFPLHFGGAGFWWGMVMGALVSVILLHFRFQSKMVNARNAD